VIVFVCEYSHVLNMVSDVCIMFDCTYSSEVLARCIFTRISRLRRNIFELDHCLGEGETFMFAVAERRRRGIPDLI
jgi:hypothetical protein